MRRQLDERGDARSRLLKRRIDAGDARAAGRGRAPRRGGQGRKNLSTRIHLLGPNGQDITPATWQALLPMMEVCRPLQGAAAVRFELTISSLMPGAVQLILCSVTVNQPSGRALMVVNGSDLGTLQCNIQ